MTVPVNSRVGSDALLQKLMGVEVLLSLLIATALLCLALADENKKLRKSVDQLALQLPCPACPTCPACPSNDQPPLIALPESQGFKFASGRAEIPPNFAIKLVQEVIPRILSYAEKYGTYQIEVIGHTDETLVCDDAINKENRSELCQRMTNLDRTLLDFLSGRAFTLQYSDNAGLGMARAAAVTKLVKDDPRIKARNFSFMPLSAGQTMLPNGEMSPGQDIHGKRVMRRRIEIYLRRRVSYQ